MDLGLEAKIKLKLKEFLRRDYREDVDRLNRILGKSGAAADLVRDMPPFPFAGDPFALGTGNCIAVIGINPRWNGWDSKSGNHYKPKKCIDSFIAGDEQKFDEFLLMRAAEFKEGAYYGTYYTRLGNHLFREWFSGKVSAKQEGPDAAREVFRRYVLKTDLLPWFSGGTANISAESLRSSNDSALLAHYEILSLLFHGLKPKWIQFNGLQMLNVIEAITRTDLEKIQIGDRLNIRIGRSKRFFDTPVLVHGFVNSQGGPQSAEQFKLVAQQFRTRINDNSYFKFGTEKEGLCSHPT